MRQKKLISLEQLEYEVYKNDNETRIKKLITLDEIFNTFWNLHSWISEGI